MARTADEFDIDAPAVRETFFSDSYGWCVSDPKYWRPEEKAFLAKYYGRVSTETIAKKLGRDEAAVYTQAKKKQKLAPVTRWDGVYSSVGLARALGIYKEAARNLLAAVPKVVEVNRWGRARVIDMPEARRFPTVILWRRNTPMPAVYHKRLARWLADPLNHWAIMWRDDLIANRELSDIVRHAQRRWGDRLLGTGEAAQMYGITHGTICTWINDGLLPSSVKFSNWILRQSELEAVLRRKGLYR